MIGMIKRNVLPWLGHMELMESKKVKSVQESCQFVNKNTVK